MDTIVDSLLCCVVVVHEYSCHKLLIPTISTHTHHIYRERASEQANERSIANERATLLIYLLQTTLINQTTSFSLLSGAFKY